MNPSSDAFDRLGGAYDVRVLEPSPPAVNDGDQFSDDPATRADRPVAPGRLVVAPTGDGDLRWSDLCADDAALAAWCAPRWLAAWPRLGPVPSTFATTRESLRTLACHVVAPARKAAVGRFGLRRIRGGFGTPFFGADRQVRIAGASIVVQDGDDEASAPITTVRAAADFAAVTLTGDPGVGADVPPLDDPDADLAVDPVAADALGAWYGFAASVLEEVRWQRRALGPVSRVQLWPEHFDLAFDHGADRAGAVHANLGASPGDAAHPEPYLYIGPWEPREGDFWNESFGASLAYADVLATDDQRATAIEFFTTGLDLLG